MLQYVFNLISINLNCFGSSCRMIALGNGTGCRETEAIISSGIASGTFTPVDAKYCIVNEDGSSVYSVSEIAEKELPKLDQNHRSAGGLCLIILAGWNCLLMV